MCACAEVILRRREKYVVMMKLLAVFFVLSLGLVAPEVSSNELDEEYNKLGDIWSNCGNSNDMSTIKSVTITPDPPKSGKTVKIEASFSLKENLTGGSFKAKVKYSFFPSVSKTIDLCDLAKLGGLSCPISQNTTQVVLEQQLPSFPGGHYTGQVTGVDQNGKRIGCINIDFQA